MLPGPPETTEVFGLDPDVIRVQLGPDGEELTPAGRVQDGIRGQFGHDQHRVIKGRARRKVPSHRTARVLHLVRAPWVRTSETRGYGRLRHHPRSARGRGESGGP